LLRKQQQRAGYKLLFIMKVIAAPGDRLLFTKKTTAATGDRLLFIAVFLTDSRN